MGVLRENYKHLTTYNVQPNLKEKNNKKDEKQHSNLLVYPHITHDRKPIQFWGQLGQQDRKVAHL